jgi:hypothetical protein
MTVRRSASRKSSCSWDFYGEQSRAVSIVGMNAKVSAGTVVIVIDVIRAFTTVAVAFERGATEIVCPRRSRSAESSGDGTRIAF